jgi:hypothetical protein
MVFDPLMLCYEVTNVTVPQQKAAMPTFHLRLLPDQDGRGAERKSATSEDTTLWVLSSLFGTWAEIDGSLTARSTGSPGGVDQVIEPCAPSLLRPRRMAGQG